MFGKFVTNVKGNFQFAVSVGVVQICFLVIFAVFGEYDEFATVRGGSTPPDSKDNIQEYYGSKNLFVMVVFLGACN